MSPMLSSTCSSTRGFSLPSGPPGSNANDERANVQQLAGRRPAACQKLAKRRPEAWQKMAESLEEACQTANERLSFGAACNSRQSRAACPRLQRRKRRKRRKSVRPKRKCSAQLPELRASLQLGGTMEIARPLRRCLGLVWRRQFGCCFVERVEIGQWQGREKGEKGEKRGREKGESGRDETTSEMKLCAAHVPPTFSSAPAPHSPFSTLNSLFFILWAPLSRRLSTANHCSPASLSLHCCPAADIESTSGQRERPQSNYAPPDPPPRTGHCGRPSWVVGGERAGRGAEGGEWGASSGRRRTAHWRLCAACDVQWQSCACSLQCALYTVCRRTRMHSAQCTVQCSGAAHSLWRRTHLGAPAGIGLATKPTKPATTQAQSSPLGPSLGRSLGPPARTASRQPSRLACRPPVQHHCRRRPVAPPAAARAPNKA